MATTYNISGTKLASAYKASQGTSGSSSSTGSSSSSYNPPSIASTASQIAQAKSGTNIYGQKIGGASTPSVFTSGGASDIYSQAKNTLEQAKASYSGYDANGMYNTDTAKAAKAGINDQITYLDSLIAQSDASTKAQLQGIRDEYASMQRSQEQANKAYEGGVTTAGLVSGRARYAPEIQAGIESGAVNYGLNQLTDIQNKKQKALADAETASMDRNYKLVSEKASLYNQLLKDERDVTAKISDEYYKSKADKRAEIESVYANQIPGVAATYNKLPDDASKAAYLQSVAPALGLTPMEVYQGVQTANQELNKSFASTIMKFATDYPDAYISTKDIQSGDMDSVMYKVVNSPSYKTKSAVEKAELDAKMAKIVGDDSAVSYYSDFLIENGKMPPNTPGELAGVIYNKAIEDAKTKIADGTVVSKNTGFVSDKLSGAEQTTVNAAKIAMDMAAEMKEVISSGNLDVGLIARTYGLNTALEKSFGRSEEQIIYDFYRTNIISQLAKARSGAAVSEQEFARLNGLLPTKYDRNSKNIEAINVFEDSMKKEVKTNLDSRNATIKGFDWTTNKELKEMAKFDK